jgi:hypothetical protein
MRLVYRYSEVEIQAAMLESLADCAVGLCRLNQVDP